MGALLNETAKRLDRFATANGLIRGSESGAQGEACWFTGDGLAGVALDYVEARVTIVDRFGARSAYAVDPEDGTERAFRSAAATAAAIAAAGDPVRAAYARAVASEAHAAYVRAATSYARRVGGAE